MMRRRKNFSWKSLFYCALLLTEISTTAGDNAVVEEEQDGKEEEPPENHYENYEEFEPNFLEPIMMTEMWSGNEKKFVYHYPKTTVVTFRAFDVSFKLMLKRRDSVFAGGVSMSDYHEEEPDKNFREGETTAPDVLSSVCMYDAHILKTNHSSGMIGLCEQRLEGIISFENDGFRLWTKEQIDDDDGKKKIVHRIARLSSAKNPDEDALDLSHDGGDDADDDFMDQIQANFTKMRQNETRWRAATSDSMDSTINRRFVELFILADDMLDSSYGGDRGKVNQKIAGIVALMNALYQPLNIKFLIRHIKYDFGFRECAGIDTSDSMRFITSYLHCVKAYRARASCEEPNGPMRKSDHLMLVTGHKFCDPPKFRKCVLGLATIYTICSWDSSVSVSSAPASTPVWEAGLTISHELGHSFGAMHDWNLNSNTRHMLAKQGARPLGGCTCTLPNGQKEGGETRKCIMSPIVDKRLSWSWSDCSYADIDFAKEANIHRCLFNRLDKYESIERLLQSSCGNGRLDPGEQCENQGTGCCTDRCLLRQGAQCNDGPCCTADCKLKAKGAVCNEAVKGPCDEDDICDGKSFECNVIHKPNGTPCKNAHGDASHCYRGECRAQTDGCTDVLGEGFVANLQLMRFPMGDGVRRNGCTAKPCEYKRLIGKYLSRSEFLDTTLKTCLTDEDSVCGSLICRNQGGRQRRNVGNVMQISIRHDFHRVMSDRFGEEKWARTLRHAGLVHNLSDEKIRQGAEMTVSERMEILSQYSAKIVRQWTDNDKLLFFPIHNSNPGMAPTGASCGPNGSKLCHNGRCLELGNWRKLVWDPSDDLHAVVPPSGEMEASASSPSLFVVTWFPLLTFSIISSTLNAANVFEVKPLV